jgi:hypothetical protein
MTVTFDTYTKRNRFFYNGLIISFATAIYVAWAVIFNVQFKQPLMGFMDATLIIGTLTTLAFVSVAGTGLVKTYIKDDDLVLAGDYLVINGLKIPLNEANEINLKVAIATKKTLGNLLSNRISVTDGNNETYQNRFVVRGYNRYIELENILNEWRTNGVAFNLRYYNI